MQCICILQSPFTNIRKSKQDHRARSQSCLISRSKPDQRCSRAHSIYEFETVSQSKLSWLFRLKNRPIRFEMFFTRRQSVDMDVCRHCIEVLEFKTCFRESKIIKSLTYGLKKWKYRYRYLNIIIYVPEIFSKNIRYIFTEAKSGT